MCDLQLSPVCLVVCPCASMIITVICVCTRVCMITKLGARTVGIAGFGPPSLRASEGSLLFPTLD